MISSSTLFMTLMASAALIVVVLGPVSVYDSFGQDAGICSAAIAIAGVILPISTLLAVTSHKKDTLREGADGADI